MPADPPMSLETLIRTIPDYPKPGILFRDITTLLKDPAGFRQAVDALVERHRGRGVAKVAGIEARGFILGGAVAHGIGAGFVPVRKRGKLPWDTIGHDYELEYGADRVELHIDAVQAGERVLVVDDLIATGGTAEATMTLITRAGGQVVEACFVIELPELGGRARLERLGVSVHALLEFAGH
jgi:adenine phosphoribosyltransferase